MTSATDTSVNQTRSVMLTLLNDYNDTVILPLILLATMILPLCGAF